jgi:hypothetical protein
MRPADFEAALRAFSASKAWAMSEREQPLSESELRAYEAAAGFQLPPEYHHVSTSVAGSLALLTSSPSAQVSGPSTFRGSPQRAFPTTSFRCQITDAETSTDSSLSLAAAFLALCSQTTSRGMLCRKRSSQISMSTWTGMGFVLPNRLFDTDAQVRPRLWRSCSLRAGQLRR